MKHKRKILFIIISMLLIIAFVSILILPKEHCELSEKEWYNINTEKLTAYKPSANELQAAKMFTKQAGGNLYRIYFYREGLIRIDENSWIYVKSHSFHDHEYTASFSWKLKHYIGKYLNYGSSSSPSKIYVGDAILAVDSNGRIYKNNGHVCAGVEIGAEQEIKTIEDFFSKTFGADDSKWEIIDKNSN